MSQLRSHTCCHLLSHFSVSQWRTLFFFLRKKYSWSPSVCETGQAGNNRDNLTQTVEPGVSQPSRRVINPWVTPSLLLSFSWLLPKRFFWVSRGLTFSQKTSAPHVSGNELSGEGYERERSQPGPFSRPPESFRFWSRSPTSEVFRKNELWSVTFCCFDFKKCLSLRPRRSQPATLKHAS